MMHVCTYIRVIVYLLESNMCVFMHWFVGTLLVTCVLAKVNQKKVKGYRGKDEQTSTEIKRTRGEISLFILRATDWKCLFFFPVITNCCTKKNNDV